ncbi:MAG: alpha/beta hydrolase [Betaproteobacteria bacterium]
MNTDSLPSRIISSGAARLPVTETGHGDALLCVHAGVADSRMWLPQMCALKEARRVIAFDQRGFGESQYSPESFSRAADALAVMDALNMPSATLMGCSMGGRVAIDVALNFPARVKALVLVAASVAGAPQPEHYSITIQAKLDAADAAETRGELDAVNELETQLWLDGPEARAGRVGGKIRELLIDMNGIALRAPPVGEERIDTSCWERIEEISVPTLVIWGTLDFPHIVARMRELVRRLPNARWHVMADAAHLPGLERPGEFNAVVGDFLRESVGG